MSDEPSGEPAEPLLAPSLPADQLAGQRLIAGFSGTEVPKGLRRMIASGEIAGVVLFAGNVDGKRGVRRLVGKLQRIDRPKPLTMPLAVMVDQEGGLVKRVPGPPSASAEEMGERGAGFARRQGAATARNLRGLGINVDLAPVLDVARSGGAIAGEDRSFGSSPRKVTRVGVDGFAGGLRDGGVAATAKHFPGLGAAEVNTDDASQVIKTPKRRIRSVDEPPFGAFIDGGGELVMLSHATYTAFSDRPATFSRAIVSGELRRRLGFEGVSITDSLDAAAALAFGSRARVAVAAAEAGNDLLLYGDWRTARRAGAALRRKLASGKLDRDAFEASVERVLELRRGLSG
jgi:beta-N-acetylhexosaminidase